MASDLKIDTGKCVGCRTCEIACSFHHRRVFAPELSSLEVREGTEWPGISILLYRKQGAKERGSHVPCDGCEGETEVLCSKYCPAGAIRIERPGGCRG